MLDLHTVDPEVGGFFGGFAWEGYGYLVPCRSFQVYDKRNGLPISTQGENYPRPRKTTRMYPECHAALAKQQDKQCSALVTPPSHPWSLLYQPKGPVGGVNTNLSADGFAWSSSFLGSDSTAGGSGQKAGRLQPAYSGKLVRVDLSDFSSSGVQVR